MLAIEIEEGGELDYLKTIIAAAKGSVGSKEYRNIFIFIDGKCVDVTFDGEYSCAYSTTVIFHRFGLLQATHTTVLGFEEEVQQSENDWIRAEAPFPGAVGILEGKKHVDGSVKNRHTFICLGEGLAIHNGFQDDVGWAPVLCAIEDFQHHTGEKRHAEAYYIHRRLLRE
jgi:hypothetical protein